MNQLLLTLLIQLLIKHGVLLNLTTEFEIFRECNTYSIYREQTRGALHLSNMAPHVLALPNSDARETRGQSKYFNQITHDARHLKSRVILINNQVTFLRKNTFL